MVLRLGLQGSLSTWDELAQFVVHDLVLQVGVDVQLLDGAGRACPA